METLVIVELKVKTQKIDDFLEKSKTMIEETIQEKGCLEYELFKNIKRENIFIFREKFKNKEAFEKHQKTSHFKKFFNYSIQILEGEPTINIF